MQIVQIIRDNWQVLLIPLIAGAIGWGTNVVAVHMLFKPLEFVGFRPYLGWQGIIPASSRRMGRYLAYLISRKLVNLKDLFGTMDPEHLMPRIQPTLWQIADDLLDDTVRETAQPLWNSLDDRSREQVRNLVRTEVEHIARHSVSDLQEGADELLDIAAVVEAAIEKNREILNTLFLVAGSEEFKFIKISGLYFGFLFGIPQMILWIYFPAWWTLPIAGIAVGYVTNWLAMKMIFEPRTPVRFGPFEFHGLFHKRQKEVAAGFSETVAARVLTPDNLTERISQGPGREKLLSIFRNRVNERLDIYRKHPMAATITSQAGPEKIDRFLVRTVGMQLTERGSLLWTFMERTVDLAGSMTGRLKQLDPESFEGLLRPAFQQDEWKLIVMGAVLGGVAGWLQAVYLFGESMR